MAHNLMVGECSTPFGIKDSCTCSRSGRNLAAVRRCAQRLSASKIPAHNSRCITSVPSICAQRLSASKIPALLKAHWMVKNNEVLNAFSASKIPAPCAVGAAVRASMCSTPFGIKDSCTQWTNARQPIYKVLNAFRHQRFLHQGCYRKCQRNELRAQRLSASKIPAPSCARLSLLTGTLCSTPFGIKDSCTRHRGRPRRRIYRVLNAFRHQRFLHTTGTAVTRATTIRCSTPFGIKDSCTRRHTGKYRLLLQSAQRLSASKIPAPDKARKEGNPLI